MLSTWRVWVALMLVEFLIWSLEWFLQLMHEFHYTQQDNALIKSLYTYTAVKLDIKNKVKLEAQVLVQPFLEITKV